MSFEEMFDVARITTDDALEMTGIQMITISHLEPLAQVI